MKLPNNSNKYNIFFLYTGYVEDCAISPLIFHRLPTKGVEHPTWQEAWEDSFKSLRECVVKCALLHSGIPTDDARANSARQLNFCCEKVVSKKDFNFCNRCGKDLRSVRKRNVSNEELRDMVVDFIQHHVVSNTNDSSYEMHEVAAEMGWEFGVGFFHINKEAISVVNEKAEDLIVSSDEAKFLWDKEKYADGFWSNVDLCISDGFVVD